MSRAAGERASRWKAVDLFCGAGGSSLGATRAGFRVVASVDASEMAASTYRDNFKGTRVFIARCEDVSARRLQDRFGSIDLLLASPECTSHTCAKGGRQRSEKSRKTALQVLRFARVLKPRWIVIENVINMRQWRRYKTLLGQFQRLGYKSHEHTLDASDFGVPQSRKRLFVIFDRLGTPPATISMRRGKRPTARSVINVNGTYAYSPLLHPRRAAATLLRARTAMKTVGRRKPFLLVYYGSDWAGWQPLGVPLRTITTLDRFAHVRPGRSGHEMRMLQVPELKTAMGFPQDFRLKRGTRRDKIRLLGNAVCPPVMAAVLRALKRTPNEA